VVAESPEFASRQEQLRGERMRTPDEVAAMLRLKELGWGERRIAAAVGCNRRTVRRHLAAAGWVSHRVPRRSKALDGLEGWLAERFRRHRGNAEAVRQDLEREKAIAVSLRTVERAAASWRRELVPCAL
jgi:predicted transcriptional regulator